MLLASLSIPYSTMTCLISNETNLSVMVQQDNCMSNAISKANSQRTFRKEACCLFNNGIVDVAVELIHSNWHSIAAFAIQKTKLLVPTLYFIDQDFSLAFYQNLDRPPDIPIRILQQSFLC